MHANKRDTLRLWVMNEQVAPQVTFTLEACQKGFQGIVAWLCSRCRCRDVRLRGRVHRVALKLHAALKQVSCRGIAHTV